MRFTIVGTDAPLPSERRVEIVERKGLGHPDSMCDAVAEELSIELSRFYLAHTGRILHHNVDKALLAAGQTAPRFGGGTVVEPMQILLAGRATLAWDGLEIPVVELAEGAVRGWLARNLHALDAERHVRVSCLVRPGSSELVDLFEEQGVLANDTSCGVGYAPLSDVERLALAVEEQLTSGRARTIEPALGEDIKVMAVRQDDAIDLTISCAMVDAALSQLADYARARERAADLALQESKRITSLPVQVDVNAGDDLSAGRVFLTVTGTSAEAGDDGQAGRGNRVNGLITPGRAMTIESVAGKNPITHVGKLYNLAAGLAAERLVDSLPEIRGAACRLVSRIGHPIEEPQLVEVQIAGVDPQGETDLCREIERIMREELDHLPQLAEELVRGDLRLNRWPFRA